MSNEGRRWFEKRKDFVGRARSTPQEVPEKPDLLSRCPSCGESVFNEALAKNLLCCPLCGHHFRLEAQVRLEQLVDPGTLVFVDEGLQSLDPLEFVDSKAYTTRIEIARAKTGRNDAFLSCSATMGEVDVEIGCFDFRFMGGSMGSVVGESITRLFERAAERKHPAIVISSSGGARMQEGVLSLMQMAKTSAALAKLQDDAKMPYISVLSDPTTGGVAASFSMLGDLTIAEPGAMIGFAGARVIEQTIGEQLPEGFQTSEYLLEHGMLDAIVPRDQLRHTLIRFLRQLLDLPSLEKDDPLLSRASIAGGTKPGDSLR